MKVVFTDSFFDSLKKLNRGERFYMKFINFIRYDILRIFKNAIRFRKLLWDYHSFDYRYSLLAFKLGLEPLLKTMKKGLEVDSTRIPKEVQLEKTINLLNNIIDEDYTGIAEKELNKEINTKYTFCDDQPIEISDSNKEIFDLSDKIAKKEWDELWLVLKGHKTIEGSDLRGWWD